MGNLINTIKKFISNKNTVTILGVILGIVVLYVGYNWRVNEKVKFVSVLYAKEEIGSNTQITSDMIGTININSELLKNSPNIIQNIRQITDSNGELFFVNFDSTVPKGSLLYSDALVSKDEKADSKLEKVPDGFRYFYFEVDLASTLGNAIAPDSSIDIYAYIDSNQTKMFGKLYTNINVIDVVDRSWATTSGKDTKEPDLLIALVSEADYRILEKAKRINGIELIPAPNNSSYEEMKKENGDTEISSYELQMFIESEYISISEN